MLIRRIGVIGRTYRHIQRYSEILGTLFKLGFGDLVISLRVEQYLDIGRQMIFRQKKEKIETLSRAVRVRMVLEELGPTFIKLGQVLSTRPDILPEEFLQELVKLQDEVPPFPFEEAQKNIEQELDGPLERFFSMVDPTPLAAASIGQVHRATLITGEDVAIKIRRPNIRRMIEVDLEILYHLASLLEKHIFGWELHRPTEVVEEFGHTLERELDYRAEASNMERMAEQHRDDPRYFIPRVFRQASGERLLTMDFVEGIPAGNLERLREAGYDLGEIARLGAELIMRQTLVHGFFHADPHPGNLRVLPGPVICLLDLGMVGRLDRETRERIVDLVLAVARQDPASLVEALLKVTDWDEEPDRRALERATGEFMDDYFFRAIKDVELGKALQDLFRIAQGYRLRVPANLLFLIKALTATEGLGRRLDPDFDVIKQAAPFVKKAQLQRLSPKRVAGDFWAFGVEFLDIIKDFPGEARTLGRMAKQGKLKIEIRHVGLEEMRVAQDRNSNRLAFAVVLAALVIGSSVVIQSGIPPTWHGIPIIGLAGYVVAGLMAFWLLISILRRGMM
ncbi:MAG: AarF/ABC1/UbiB kinase family protein [Pseudomonadota bacterium]